MIEKEKFNALCDKVEKLEEEKKELAEEIKDSISMAASEGNSDKKAVGKAVKEYLRYKKDTQTYISQDLEISNILCATIPEFSDS